MHMAGDIRFVILDRDQKFTIPFSLTPTTLLHCTRIPHTFVRIFDRAVFRRAPRTSKSQELNAFFAEVDRGVRLATPHAQYGALRRC